MFCLYRPSSPGRWRRHRRKLAAVVLPDEARQKRASEDQQTGCDTTIVHKWPSNSPRRGALVINTLGWSRECAATPLRGALIGFRRRPTKIVGRQHRLPLKFPFLGHFSRFGTHHAPSRCPLGFPLAFRSRRLAGKEGIAQNCGVTGKKRWSFAAAQTWKTAEKLFEDGHFELPPLRKKTTSQKLVSN